MNNDCDDGIQDQPKRRSRKRLRNPKEHKVFRLKSSVQQGKAHVSKKGKLITAKTFILQTKCCCPRNCYQVIDAARQKEIFNVYYNFENWCRKCLFLRSMVDIYPRRENLKLVITTTKSYRYEYHMIDKNGTRQRVCQKFLLQCLQISDYIMYKAVRSSILNANAIDHRGHFPNRLSKSDDFKFIYDFIKSFPTFQSHYSSSKSNVKYLNPSLNITRMYREYCLVCNFKSRNILSQWKFSHIFNTKFNLRFHRPKVDTCKTCDRLENLIKSTTDTRHLELKSEKVEHLTKVNKCKTIFHETIEEAKTRDSKIEIRTFDLQRALEVPYLSTSEAYYKRQLWVYNLCIHDEVRGIAYMYVWPECTASRGAEEIASCLYKNFHVTIPEDTEKIILYSDSCGGQNRNIKMTMMIKYLLDSWPHSSLKTIEQRFFVVGHSYNSCDRNFALIERQKRLTEDIFVPIHWVNLIKQAKKKAPRFVVTEMKMHDFSSWKRLLSLIINRKHSIDGDKISWLHFQRIVYERDDPFGLKIETRNSNVSSFIQISLRKRHVNRISNVVCPVLYPNGRAISRKKYKDLQDLVEYIPTKYHQFYQRLKFEVEDGEI